jgi:hypothetical protein
MIFVIGLDHGGSLLDAVPVKSKADKKLIVNKCRKISIPFREDIYGRINFG